MADWKIELPGTVAEGDPGHVKDHNTIVDAIKEARTNVDEIPAGKTGDKGEPGKDGAAGDKGEPGKDGAPTQEEWDDALERITALEA